MKYYIEEQAWEVILSFFNERNGIHNKHEEKMRHFIEAIGGFSTKIHALVDALGNPLKFILIPIAIINTVYLSNLYT
ncbi:hypothetical protein [Candidatus Tisiphia endosymbiont of Neophilaenus lineatus]|uniref:hypothetical protein n=1 Tax=Candidatus Tisiphia endosymbiont of Neophilaenus lineatus TaxID=3139336 RepID=UPI0035CB6245